MSKKLPGPVAFPDPDTPPTRHYLSCLTRVGDAFSTPGGARFLSYPYGDGTSCTLPLHHPAVRTKASLMYREERGEFPGDSAIRNGFRLFQDHATKETRNIHLRLGQADDAIHIDTGYSGNIHAGKHFKIDAQGWRLEVNSLETVLPKTAAPFPDFAIPREHSRHFNGKCRRHPNPHTALDPLRTLLRLDNDRPAWLRVLTWLFAALRPQASPGVLRDYPILQISGPAGSGKTTAARILRSLVDPSTAPINTTPSTESAASRLARDNHVIFIDGTTRLARRPSELLARLSTGMPVDFHGDPQNTSRPILLTINETDAAQKLHSRILPVELPPLESPLPPEELHKRIEAMRAAVFPALMTLLSTAIRRLPEVPLPQNARFPEATQWFEAAMSTQDEKELVCVTSPENSFEAKIMDLLAANGGEWKGTASELNAILETDLIPRALSVEIRKIPHLCVTENRTKHKRTLHLSINQPDPQPAPPRPVQQYTLEEKLEALLAVTNGEWKGTVSDLNHILGGRLIMRDFLEVTRKIPDLCVIVSGGEIERTIHLSQEPPL